MNKVSFSFPSFLLSTLMAAFIFAQYSCSKPNNQGIDELIKTYQDYGFFNGSVLIAKGGEIIHQAAYGEADKDQKIPNAVDTKFRLASVSKQFTAFLIMRLVADGKLDLQAPVIQYLPKLQPAAWEEITIHHLLTHTSGIPSYTSFPNYREIMDESYEPVDLVNLFVDSTLNFVPGERYEYSNSGYSLLGYLLEVVSSKSYGKLLKEEIFKPLGMQNSGYNRTNEVVKNHAIGYYNQWGDFSIATPIDMSIAYAAGGLYSTVEDLYKWDQALYGEEMLSKEYKDLLFGEHFPNRDGHYAYGWNVGKIQIGNQPETKWAIHHDGIINGFSSILVRIPADTTTIIILNNTGGAPLYEMVSSILAVMDQKEYDLPQKALTGEMYQRIKTKGIDSAMDFYEREKKNEAYFINEQELNSLGYHLLFQELNEEAVKILELACKIYTTSFNAYDSYGEALLAVGDTAAAISNYKKSIWLNPDNANGIRVLQALGISENELKVLRFGVLTAPESVRQELYHLPLHFATDIPHEGIEDARFLDGWSDEDSHQFWSYAFAWFIQSEEGLKQAQLEKDLRTYFDGLMQFIDKDRGEVPLKTSVNLKKQGDNYQGEVSIFDAFFRREAMSLQLKIEQQYCPELDKWLVLFRFSPANYDAAVWKDLEEIKVAEGICSD